VAPNNNTVTVFVAFGSNPTATTSSLLLAAGYNYFNFVSGQKVAAISSGGSSTISILDLD